MCFYMLPYRTVMRKKPPIVWNPTCSIYTGKHHRTRCGVADSTSFPIICRLSWQDAHFSYPACKETDIITNTHYCSLLSHSWPYTYYFTSLTHTINHVTRVLYFLWRYHSTKGEYSRYLLWCLLIYHSKYNFTKWKLHLKYILSVMQPFSALHHLFVCLNAYIYTIACLHFL